MSLSLTQQSVFEIKLRASQCCLWGRQILRYFSWKLILMALVLNLACVQPCWLTICSHHWIVTCHAAQEGCDFDLESQWWILKSWPHIPLAPVCDRRIKILKNLGEVGRGGCRGTRSEMWTVSQRTLRKPPSPLQYFQQQSYWWLNLWGAGYGWWILCSSSMEQQRITRQTVNHLPTAGKNRIWLYAALFHCTF